MITHPISVYINWAAYDELSDAIELTEEIALRQLEELLRLRKQGVQFDYYLMDCFWFDPDGGYRTWRKPHWANGPDRFLEICKQNNVKPGLWIGGNSLAGLEPVSAWQDSIVSYTPDALFRGAACLFTGGFLPDLLDALKMWYERGVRMFKFDFMNLNVAPPALQQTMLPSEIRHANEQAFLAGMKTLRAQCPDVVLLGYNGFEEIDSQSGTGLPFRKTIGTHWLEAFDSLYCGDPRPADVPTMNFWRSKDIYSDHMVRVYERNSFPLERIDNAGFMIGTTGTCYYRRTAAWQGMLLLSLARGGWVNTYYGNLDLLDAHQADWFARAQRLFLPIQSHGRIRTFGGIPGLEQPYGFLAEDANGALLTVVNPTQQTVTLPLPMDGKGCLLFTDAGFLPEITPEGVTLGAEQMALLGFGSYNDPAFSLGVQEDVHIPAAIHPLDCTFTSVGHNLIQTTILAPENGSLRLILRQRDSITGFPRRTTGGSPPNGISLGNLLTLSAEQAGRALPIQIEYDKTIWSGLSWAVGEIAAGVFMPDVPIQIRMQSAEAMPMLLTGQIYQVEK